MATDIESRKLVNLRVIDLRTELAKRNLDKTGVKNELIERLQKALIADGHDPEAYIFDVDTSDKKPSRNSKRRTMGEGEMDKEDSGANDSSFVSEEDAQENKEDEATHVEQNKENLPQESNTTTSETETSTPPQQQQQQQTSSSDIAEKPAENTAEVSEDKIELNASPIKISGALASTPDEQAESTTKETPIAAAAEETLTKDENPSPKEQRNSIVKKNITEESKEKPNDTNKEDNEDSINLTIGEDEVKLFGEEEDSSHEKDTKDEQQQSGNAGQEGEKEANPDKASVAKSEQEGKQDQKTPAKKVTTPKGNGSSRNLWVSGLSSMTRATDLKTLFSKFGKVVGAKIVTNAKTPGSRCYGYVTMLSADDATVSMQNLNKTELDGRMISVERAKDDGTGPARPKVAKKEPEKKKAGADAGDDKKSDSKKPTAVKTEGDAKPDDKKDEKKSTSIKDTSEDVNGESKTGSVKSDKLDQRGRSAGNRGFIHEPRNRSRENGKPRSGVLTFAQIKEERERNRLKEKERALRLEERRRHIERERQREIERRQREEAVRLERERVKLKMEREKIEREKAELLKLEREAQRLERERLQREKEEIRRAQMKLEESRRAIKRPMEIPRSFDDDRKRRPPSPDRRHIHVSSSSSNRKEIPPRSNGARGRSPPYVSNRRDGYDSSAIDSSRKDPVSHSSRDKSGKESSRYDHHSYKSSHASEDVRTNDLRHRYPDMSSKSSSNKESSRYDRNVPSEGWSRSTSGMSSAVKSFSGGLSGSGSASLSSRDPWQPSSSDRKSDAQPPWARSGGSTSDRWANPSGSSSSMSMNRSGPIGSSGGAMFSGSGGYSDAIPSMGMMNIPSSASYNDRFDAYKSGLSRKY